MYFDSCEQGVSLILAQFLHNTIVYNAFLVVVKVPPGNISEQQADSVVHDRVTSRQGFCAYGHLSPHQNRRLFDFEARASSLRLRSSF